MIFSNSNFFFDFTDHWRGMSVSVLQFLEQKIVYWKELLQNPNDEVIAAISKQLLLDWKQYTTSDQESRLELGCCAHVLPGINGRMDQETNIATSLSQCIWKQLSAEQITTYLSLLKGSCAPEYELNQLYSLILRTLRNPLRRFLIQSQQMNNDCAKRREPFHQVRGTGQIALWSELQTQEVSKQILCPEAMPVTLSPLSDLQPFLSYLEENKEIKEILRFPKGILYPDNRLDLCKCGVKDSLPFILQRLCKNKTVRHFLFGNNVCGVNGATLFADYMNQSRNPIHTWYLAGNDLNAESLQIFCHVLIQNPGETRALWLKRNPIGCDMGAIVLASVLMKTKLKILDLDNTGLLDTGFAKLIQSIKMPTSLKHLYLSGNAITTIPLDMFQCLPLLRTLYIGINRLGDVGSQQLVAALVASPSLPLTRLNLGSNRMSGEGMATICHYLMEGKKSLKFLSFGTYKSTADLKELPNQMNEIGMNAIEKMLAQPSCSLQILDLTHIGMSHTQISRLARVLKCNTSLIDLIYQQYGLVIEQELKQEIQQTLEMNCQRQFQKTRSQMKKDLRFIRHPKDVQNIDSEYRTGQRKQQQCILRS